MLKLRRELRRCIFQEDLDFWIFSKNGFSENDNLGNDNLFEAAHSLLLRPPLPPVDSSILSELPIPQSVWNARTSARTEPGLVVYSPVGSVGRPID